ncbi:MAG: fumarylacetoacetate hydrolase family protein [Burkholderiales bacterium]
MQYVIDAPPTPSVPVVGQKARFPVHRIYCVGRNYAAHTREMGKDPDKEPPFFFMKPADAVLPEGGDMHYPPGTKNLHHEMELVVAIHRAGSKIPVERALDYVYGYAAGLDMTRRDLQSQAKDAGRPWDFGKGFDESAPIGPIYPVATHGHHSAGSIMLKVNDQIKQNADLNEMIWNVPETISYLSDYYTLQPGDLIYTGTPAGVGAVAKGDVMVGTIAGLGELRVRMI